ncbi:hypothetical protein SAMN05444336_102336 [Albimonas donghaensis]|uniref:Uncharacterized protein n=1 Tax=Albimonas donghaensis TaxID=356660 RepID=A0A1H2WDI2_9RHOB|nr:DUF6134 family protein [Albimonas donghaensis]SDW78324.1 hypothetical protein SAMN05444336_102336 [Albimonas donghaensis]
MTRSPLFAPSRRTLLGTGLAAGGLALGGWPARRARAATASRGFEILRDGDVIGDQLTTVAADGPRLDVTVRVRIALKVLGVVAYRYELDSRELWENGLLVSLDGTTNDDGERETARVRREGDRLVSSGTHVGDMPGDAATTTYWTPAFLERSTWISTQTGAPLRVSASQDGSEAVPGPSGALTCTRWQVSGDLDLALYYDDRGEWMGNAFDAGGETARFRAVAADPRLAPLWPAG